MAIEIVDLPIKNIKTLCFLYSYVSLPEGNHPMIGVHNFDPYTINKCGTPLGKPFGESSTFYDFHGDLSTVL